MESGQIGATVLLLEVFAQVEEDTETEGTVDDLSEDSRVNASVESLDTAFSVELLGDNDGGGGTASL